MNKPAKVARIGRKDYARAELQPTLWRMQLRMLAKWMLIVWAVLMASAVVLAVSEKHYSKPKNVAGQSTVFCLSCPGRDKAGQKAVTHLQTRMVEPFFCPVSSGTERDRPICPAVPGYIYPGQVGHAMKLQPQKA